jgi:hypothetical protein
MFRLIFAAATLITLHILSKHLAIVAISTDANASTAQLLRPGAPLLPDARSRIPRITFRPASRLDGL